MISLAPFYQLNSSLFLLAPTAWGKTTLLLSLIKEFKVVYLSPLRALADEFELRCKSEKLKTQRVTGNGQEYNDNFEVLILACELLNTNIMQFLEDKDCIYVFDEFHLFYYWGESFRPKLKEALELVLLQNPKTLAMSATAQDCVIEYWKSNNRSNLHSYLINLGNHQIKTQPLKTYISFKKNKMLGMFDCDLDGINLVFCKYRNEVKELTLKLQEKGYAVHDCVSGEVELFNQKLIRNPAPNFIVSTSTLSHGVNLPSLKRIFITYDIKEKDFLLQMIGRAGRRGEKFFVYLLRHRDLGIKREILSYLLFLCHYYKAQIKRIYRYA